jgi:hypothetical protein
MCLPEFMCWEWKLGPEGCALTDAFRRVACLSQEWVPDKRAGWDEVERGSNEVLFI